MNYCTETRSTGSLSCGSTRYDCEGSKTAVGKGKWEVSDDDRKVDYTVVEIDMEYAVFQIGGKLRVVE